MQHNNVKHTLQSGGHAFGTMVFEFGSTGIGRIASAAGAEFVIYDMEHTGWSVEGLRMLIATTRPTGAVPLVRVPATQYHLLARPLDVGALGLMVPMVETAEQARLIVRSAKYFPEGARGVAFGVAHDDYAGGDIVGGMAAANAETLLIAQIETAQGVENVEEIAAVEGIDVLWIGHFDLSTSLGIPGQFDHPTYTRAIERFLAACNEHGKAAGIMVPDVATGEAVLRQGFRAIAYSGDIWIYAHGLRQGLAALRATTNT
jgi:2-keto-3-deoxy-L-rhamnonate aldolase RhmA